MVKELRWRIKMRHGPRGFARGVLLAYPCSGQNIDHCNEAEGLQLESLEWKCTEVQSSASYTL